MSGWPDMPIVVTGAAGFIGRRVVARLAAAGARVAAVDRAPAPPGLPAGVEYRCGELAETAGGAPGGVLVHLAWSLDRADARAQSAAAADFRRLLAGGDWGGVVGMGSAEEYGESEGCLREEQAPGHCLSAYGAAKHAACGALREWSGRTGRPAFWLRPFVVYGPGQGGNMVIPYAVRCARERQPAELSAGLQFRDFIHVDDVAEGIVQAARRAGGAGAAFTVCNLGRGEPVRLREVLERIAANLDAQKLFRFGVRPLRANEPQKQTACVEAAAHELGWRAQIPWEQGIDALGKQPGKDAHV
jgi:nucleoside-diphosphate-sugar epimerase